jgi:hypothetical protein
VDDPNQWQDVSAALMRWASSSPFHADRRDEVGVTHVVVDGLEGGPLSVHAVLLCVSLAEQVLFADADLNDARLVHARDADVLEDTVINLAPPGLLNNNLVPSIEQRPEG